jgi:hypothetical protein
VKVFRGGDLAVLGSYSADEARFTGGVSVAVGRDVSGPVILTGPGRGAEPRVRLWAGLPPEPRGDGFLAFTTEFRGGIFVG